MCMDRDGTIIKLIHHLTDVSRAEIIEGVIEGCKLLKMSNFRFGIFTNQSVIGHGLCTVKEVKSINDFILSEFHKNDLAIDFIYFCSHTASDKCSCRKPEIGMGLEAKHKYDIDFSESFMIGDSVSDVEFGDRLGMRTVFLSELTTSKATIVVNDFYSAAKTILQYGRI